MASPVLTSTQPPSPPSPPRASEELATGVIVGLAAGSACAFLILVLMIVMCIVYVRMGKARRPDVQALEGFPVATDTGLLGGGYESGNRVQGYRGLKLSAVAHASLGMSALRPIVIS